MQFERSSQLRGRAHRLIPGGAHTYAKGDDQYPDPAPGFIERGLGQPRVGRRRQRVHRVRHGAAGRHARPRLPARSSRRCARDWPTVRNFVRPAAIEVDARRGTAASCPAPNGQVRQERLRRRPRRRSSSPGPPPGATWSRSAPTSRSSPPTTGSSAPPPMPAGIPQAIRDLTVRFRYNDLRVVRALFADHPEPDRLPDPRARDRTSPAGAGFLAGPARALRRPTARCSCSTR